MIKKKVFYTVKKSAPQKLFSQRSTESEDDGARKIN